MAKTVHIHPTRTEYVTKRVDITEQRAPTDESVKLLSEMERAAEAKLIGSMRMAGNSFHGVVHMTETMVDQQRHLKAIFDLNGARQEVRYNDWVGTPLPEMVRALRDKMAERIASEILGETLRDVRWPK